MIINTNLTIWDLLQAIIPVANRQSLDMARRCKELRNIHQIKSTIHWLGINLTNIRVLWDHIWLNSYRFLTSVVREMWSNRDDSMFYSLIGRSILMNWAFAQQLGVLIPQRVAVHSRESCMSEQALLPHWLCNQNTHQGIGSCSPIVNFFKFTFHHGMATSVIFLIKN